MRTGVLEVKYVKWVMWHRPRYQCVCWQRGNTEGGKRGEGCKALLDISWAWIKSTIEVFNGSRKKRWLRGKRILDEK